MVLLYLSKTFEMYIGPDLLPAQLNGDLIEHVLVMVEKGTVVDPNSRGVQGLEYCIDVLEYVIGSINEKASDNARELVVSLPINLCELTGSHRKIGIFRHYLERQLVWYSH